MKKIFLFIFFICSYITVNACGPFYRTCSPKDFCIFRICGDNMTGQFNWEDNYNRNCEEWAKLTSRDIPLADIKEVVYKWDIQQIQSLKNRTTGTKTPNNAFAKWLIRHNDTEIIDFLLLAKANEQIGSKQCSVWYYYVDDDDECIQLKELIAQAKEYKGTRLKDRYILQIIRALFRCHNYDELVNVWHNNKEIFKDGVIKEMAAEYVAGAYHHMGDEEQECQALIDNGLGALIYKQKGDIDDYFTAIYEHNPDDPCLFLSLQAHHHYRFSENWYKRITAIIKENKSKEMAKWLYVGAYIADELNKPQEALSYILQAEKCVKDKDTGDAVRLLKLYLKTKTATCYDQSFETYLYNELVWLDKKISENLTDQVKTKTIEDGLYYNLYGFHYYYWNDMLRKIIIGELVPLCIKSNYITRALQYLNMADNDLFNKVGKVAVDRFWEDTTMSLKSYRNSITHKNDYDYMNDFFINLDTFDVKYAKRLVDRINHPLDNLDKFLNKNSYTDSQFFYDIIGTKLIASMKYKEAIKYLSLVSNNFQKSRNVYAVFDRDPFKNGKIGPYDCQYKLHFAQKMYSLEQKIKTSKNPNNKAEYMLEYAHGLQSSFIRCWALTSYYKGYFEGDNLRAERANNAITKVKEIKQTAFALFTDDERAARAYADWNMFKTAATLYPETQTAKEIHGHCDVLVDYQFEKWWI